MNREICEKYSITTDIINQWRKNCQEAERSPDIDWCDVYEEDWDELFFENLDNLLTYEEILLKSNDSFYQNRWTYTLEALDSLTNGEFSSYWPKRLQNHQGS